jgi:hypothetical protein
MRLDGKYRSIEFDGSKVTIRARVGRSLISSLNSEVENSFRVKQIQSIEHKKPANSWDTGVIRFNVSGREPEVPRNLPSTAAKLDMNSYSYSGKDASAAVEFIDAIEDALYD